MENNIKNNNTNIRTFYRNKFARFPGFHCSDFHDTDSFVIFFKTIDPENYLMGIREYYGSNLMKGKIGKVNTPEKALNRLNHILFINKYWDIFKLESIKKEAIKNEFKTFVVLRYIKIGLKEHKKFLKQHQVSLLLNNL